MEHLIKTIAEVKSALTQATEVIDENQMLKKKLTELRQTILDMSDTQNLLTEQVALKESPTGTNPIRDLKVIEMAYEAGRDAVIGQLRMARYETTHEIDESTYSDGFEVQYTQEVEVEIEVDSVIDECYEEEEVNLEQLKEEIYHSVDTLLESDVLKLRQITDETQA